MIKVDLVYSGFINAPNGASRFVKLMSTLKERFNSSGVDLRVISQDTISPTREICESKSFSNKGNKRGVMIERLARYSLTLTWYLLNRRYFGPVKRIADYYIEKPDDGKGDIIALQEFYTCYYFLKNRKSTKQKVYLTLHNDGLIWPMLYDRYPRFKSHFFDGFRSRVMKNILGGCDRILFVADHARIAFCKNNPSFPASHTSFVYNGIDEKELAKMPGSKDDVISFICVGTLCDRKNQMGILRAISKLPVSVQNKIKMVFVGDGSIRAEMENYSKGLNCVVDFVGNSNKVDYYLQQADCFILFSKVEGLPISIIEGMRAALPIIGSRVAGIPEQINDGKSGYIVDLDEEALAQVINKVVFDGKDKLRLMGEESYRLFRDKFTIQSMCQKYIEEYKVLFK